MRLWGRKLEMKRTGLLAHGRKVERIKKLEFWLCQMEEEAKKVRVCGKEEQRTLGAWKW